MKTPYLIQRLNFKEAKSGSFDDVLQCDYMGSAEFEWGGLPKSLKEMTKVCDSFKVKDFKKITNYKNQRFCIISTKEKSLSYFSEYFEKLLFDKLLLKENTFLKENVSGIDGFNNKPISIYNTVDAWWDIENHVIFTFGKKNATMILKAIITTRDKKKKENAVEWF